MVYRVNNKDYADLLKKYFKNYIYFDDPFEETYIYKEDELMGLISISRIYDRIEINYLLTIPKYRCLGVASKLMDFVLSLSSSISLEVSVVNISAINLYKKYGFRVVKRIKNYYDSFDGYLMVKGSD